MWSWVVDQLLVSIMISPHWAFWAGDLGQTPDSNRTLTHYELNPTKGQTVLFVGDLSYADDYPFHDNARWDTWGRFVERVAAYQPWITTVGNHEIDFAPDLVCFYQNSIFILVNYLPVVILWLLNCPTKFGAYISFLTVSLYIIIGVLILPHWINIPNTAIFLQGETKPFKPYTKRFHVPYRASNSTSPLWYSIKRASAYIIVLSSYSAYGEDYLLLIILIVIFGEFVE